MRLIAVATILAVALSTSATWAGDPVLWDNPLLDYRPTTGFGWQSYKNDRTSSLVVDDFRFDSATTIGGFEWRCENAAAVDEFSIAIYENTPGINLPAAAPIYAVVKNVAQTFETKQGIRDVFRFEMPLAEVWSLPAGTYWLSIQGVYNAQFGT